MRRTPPSLATCFLAAGVFACQPTEQPDGDPGATEVAATEQMAAEAHEPAPGDSAHMVAHRVMESLGGEQTWEANRFVAFRWMVERDGQTVANRMHGWDRYDGRYRVEFDRDGAHHVTQFNVNEVRRDGEGRKIPGGQAWVDGAPLEGEALDDALAGGYRAFINDSYWILMPYKWEDPGVHLTYEGITTLPDSSDYYTVRLDYDAGLGVTDDRFWGYVDPASGRMAAWRYHLQNQDEPGSLIWWEDWVERGGVMMAMDRRWDEGGGARIHFEDVTVSATVPEGFFAPPSP